MNFSGWSQVGTVQRFVRLKLGGALGMLLTLSAACSSSSDASPPSTPPPDMPFEGVWRAWPEGQSAFEVHVEGDRAKIVRFGPGFAIGNPEVINGGDPLLTNLSRVDAQTFKAQIADIQYAPSPAGAKSWPTSVSYVDTTLVWDESSSRWVASRPALELSKQRDDFDGKYAPAGACEKKFENVDNDTLYLCEYPQDADSCSSSGEAAFWPSTDCEHLGYAFRSNEVGRPWFVSDSSNVAPGAHGKWGDGGGGGKIVSVAAAATGGDEDGAGGSGNGGDGGTVIASCSDEWVCTEITGGDPDAFQAQCEEGGDVASTSPCPDAYKGGPACTDASFTSVGVLVHGNFYWKPDFCANNPTIDTRTTCEAEVKGTPNDEQCQQP